MIYRKLMILLVLASAILLNGGQLEEVRTEIAGQRRIREERIAALRLAIAEAHSSELREKRQEADAAVEERELTSELKRVDEDMLQLAARLNEHGISDVEQPIAEAEQLIANTRPVSMKAVDEAGQVLEGRQMRLGSMLYFSYGEHYGFLKQPADDESLPLFVEALPGQQAALRELFATGRCSALPVDFTSSWEITVPDKAGEGTAWEHFAAGGMVMLPILLCAWLTLWVMLRRFYCWCRLPLHRAKARFSEYLAALAPEGSLSDADFRKAEEHAREIVASSSRGQGVLAACGGVAPLLGLLGTVTGMIRTFTALGTEGGAGSALADGIAEALVTTEAGLLVAIPAVLLHAWGRRRSARLAVSLEDQLRRYE